MKKIYLLLVLSFILSSVFIVSAQIEYTPKNSVRQRPSNLDCYLLHSLGGLYADYNILNENPDHSDTSYFSLRFRSNAFNNEVICTNDSIVKALNTGYVIDATSTIWKDAKPSWLYLAYYTAKKFGEFQNVTNKFIGIRMDNGNGDFNYGYIQMSVTPNSAGQPSTIVVDWAYQKIAGKPIKAGQTVGVAHYIINPTQYILNDHQLRILSDKAENISISDISGHQLLNSDLHSNKNFDLSSYANGIYLIKLSGADGVITKKIMLQ